MTVSYRFLNQYRQVFSGVTPDICYLHKLILDMEKSPDGSFAMPKVGYYNETFIRMHVISLAERIRKFNPEKLHLCPMRLDDLKYYNQSSLNKSEHEFYLPDGDYRYEHKYSNDEDDNVFTKTIYEKFNTGEDPLF